VLICEIGRGVSEGNVVAICTESQQAFHIEAIGFDLNTMGATLSTFADHLKLFSRFRNQPQFILLDSETVTV
jgi:hypothetical protein